MALKPILHILKKITESWLQFQDARLPGYELRRTGIELSCLLSWQLQNNGKEGIKL
jgi:hypothetical protein